MKKNIFSPFIITMLFAISLISCRQTNLTSEDFTIELKLHSAYDNSDLFNTLIDVNDVLKQLLADTSITEKSGVGILDKMIEEDMVPKPVTEEFPLWSILYPSVQQDSIEARPIPGAVLGITKPSDTSLINRYFSMDDIKELMPNDISFIYIPIYETNGEYMHVCGLKNNSSLYLHDSSFSFHLQVGDYSDLLGGIYNKMEKTVNGESYMLFISINSVFADRLFDNAFVLNCMVGDKSFSVPLTKRTATQPIPIGIINESEKNTLFEKHPDLQIK